MSSIIRPFSIVSNCLATKINTTQIMKKILFTLLFSSLLLSVNGQNKTQLTVGSGLIINNHKQSNYDSWDGSFENTEKYFTYSYGANISTLYYLNKSIYLRSGINFYHSNFEGFTVISSSNSVSFPLTVGLKWKRLSMYTGLEYERTMFSFINREQFGEITEDNCACQLTKNTFNVPVGLEYFLSKHFLIGYKHQFLFTNRTANSVRIDELKNSYLYVNYIL